MKDPQAGDDLRHSFLVQYRIDKSANLFNQIDHFFNSNPARFQ